ncbi:MAG: site-specific integrase [Bacteroidetes bacterium]|nr:MAG: site-specific integrase [Bacteroidota bacterium]
MNASTFSVIVYALKSRINRLGTVPLYLRITVNGQRREVSLNRRVPLSLWNDSSESVKGGTEEARILNTFLQMKKSEAHRVYNLLMAEGNEITAEALRDRLSGRVPHRYTVMEVYDKKLNQIKSLIGKGYTLTTYRKYQGTQRKVQNFLRRQGKKDINLNDLNLAFVTGFDLFLRETCENNSAIKYHKTFKAVLNFALAHEYMKRDPYLNFKCVIKETHRIVLTDEELERLRAKRIDILRLQIVRDVFLFSCYTGLAYADVAGLTNKNLITGIDGKTWLDFTRKKTQHNVHIPLLDPALEILDRYKDFPPSVAKGVLLPVLSNQKVNSYLKELADICGIRKNITFHLARHTFATTVTLSNGVPLETVSKLLGHRSIKTTQIYSKVVDMKVLNDFNRLRSVLDADTTF